MNINIKKLYQILLGVPGKYWKWKIRSVSGTIYYYRNTYCVPVDIKDPVGQIILRYFNG